MAMVATSKSLLALDCGCLAAASMPSGRCCRDLDTYLITVDTKN